MANELIYTIPGGGDLRATEVLNSMVWDLLYDGTDLRSICIKVADLGGSGSSTSQTAQVNLGTAMSPANADQVSAAGNSVLPTDNLSLSIAQQIISYSISDMLQITGSAGSVPVSILRWTTCTPRSSSLSKRPTIRRFLRFFSRRSGQIYSSPCAPKAEPFSSCPPPPRLSKSTDKATKGSCSGWTSSLLVLFRPQTAETTAPGS